MEIVSYSQGSAREAVRDHNGVGLSWMKRRIQNSLRGYPVNRPEKNRVQTTALVWFWLSVLGQIIL